MIIALPIFNTRLSPLFDTAGNILLVNWNGEEEVKREFISVTSLNPNGKCKKLSELSIDILLCGAISCELLQHFLSLNIKVIPFLCGEFEGILDYFKKGDLLKNNRFTMPGCCKRRRYNRKKNTDSQ